MQSINPCLWFDNQAEAAARHYVSIFPNSQIVEISRCLEGAPRPRGTVLTVKFVLDGQEFISLNGGPAFTFSPAISLVANCETQAQVDNLWAQLLDGGQEQACGWLTDRFGVSWQVVPQALIEMLNGPDTAAAQRAFTAMMGMRKLDIAALRQAYENTAAVA